MLFLFLSPSASVRVTRDDVAVLVVLKTWIKVQGHGVLIMADIDGEAEDHREDRPADKHHQSSSGIRIRIQIRSIIRVAVVHRRSLFERILKNTLITDTQIILF